MIHPMIVRRRQLNRGFGVSWRLGSDGCSTVVKRDWPVPSSSILFAHAPFVRTTCISGWPAYSTVIEQLPPANTGGSELLVISLYNASSVFQKVSPWQLKCSHLSRRRVTVQCFCVP